ncbi:MAG: hypothetical protein L3J36_01535 [Rhodobacteraceae bacterium]|nr:hypothetical protein [Paracoccaceae bacterium]
MPPETDRIRHTLLFTLLHQKTQSEQTSARLHARSFARQELDRDEARQIQSMALASWR